MAISRLKIQRAVRASLRRYGNQVHRADSQARGGLHRALDIDSRTEQRLARLYDKWIGCSNPQFARLAQQVVVDGWLQTPLQRALYVDHLLCRARLGARHLTLWRGLDGAHADRVAKKMTKAKPKASIQVPVRRADSWTDSRQTASGFGWLVVQARIPVAQIVTCYKSNQALDDRKEYEFIVTYPGQRVSVTSAQIGERNE